MSAVAPLVSYTFDLFAFQVLGKVTTRAYGLVLDSLLREIVPLEDEINYWRETIASSRYTSLYSLQTSPWRLWDWTRGIWTDVRVQQPSKS